MKSGSDEMKNIIIEIKSDIDQLDDENHRIEITSEGHAYMKNGSMYIVYQETEVSGMEGSKTMLKLQEDCITMTRFGSTNSKMVFDEKHPMSSLYKTPYGDFEMSIITEKLTSVFKKDTYEGHIEIIYSMVLEGVSNSQNHLKISVREVSE